MIDRLEAQYPNTGWLLLDSGNLSDSPSPSGDIKTHALVEAMGDLGYRAANVGERDLAMGYDAFVERTKHAKFPFISSNVVRKDNREPVFDPYVVLEVPYRVGSATRKLRVGVIGAARHNPIFLKAGPRGSGTNLVIRNPKEVLPGYVAELREKADVVVLLAALHKEDARRLVREIDGIDYVIGAYGGIYTTREEREGETLLLYSGNQGKRIGETRLFLDEAGGVRDATTYMYFLIAKYPGLESMTAYVAKVHEKLAAVEPKPVTLEAASAGS